MSKETKVIVPGRLSYANVWEPQSINGSEPKYSVSVIIPKSDKATIQKIQQAVEQAKQEAISKFGGKIPANMKLPLRDGDIDGFNSTGNRGVAAGLGNIQKLKDGEPLGGRVRAEDEFGTVDDDDFLA